MKLVKTLILACTAVISTAAYGGGEQGNGRYVDYLNHIVGFETIYPEQWLVEDEDSLVTFREPKAGSLVPVRSAAVHVGLSFIPTASNISGLGRFLKSEYPKDQWTALSLDGRYGFKTQRNKQVIIFLFKEPKKAIVIRYQKDVGELSGKNIHTIIQTMRFAKPRK